MGKISNSGKPVLFISVILAVAAGLAGGYWLSRLGPQPVVQTNSTDVLARIAHLETRIDELAEMVANQSVGTGTISTTTSTDGSLQKRMDNMSQAIQELASKMVSLESGSFPTDTGESLPQPGAANEFVQRYGHENGNASDLSGAELDSYHESLNQTLVQDGTDSAFTGTIQERLQHVFDVNKQWSESSELVSTDCSSSLCRIVMQFGPNLSTTDRVEFQQTVLSFVTTELAGGTVKYETSPSGDEQLIAYLARQGHALPPKTQ